MKGQWITKSRDHECLYKTRNLSDKCWYSSGWPRQASVWIILTWLCVIKNTQSVCTTHIVECVSVGVMVWLVAHCWSVMGSLLYSHSVKFSWSYPRIWQMRCVCASRPRTVWEYQYACSVLWKLYKWMITWVIRCSVDMSIKYCKEVQQWRRISRIGFDYWGVCECICDLRGFSLWGLMWFTWTAMMTLFLTLRCCGGVTRRDSERILLLLLLPLEHKLNWKPKDLARAWHSVVRGGLGVSSASTGTDLFQSLCWKMSFWTWDITAAGPVIESLELNDNTFKTCSYYYGHIVCGPWKHPHSFISMLFTIMLYMLYIQMSSMTIIAISE